MKSLDYFKNKIVTVYSIGDDEDLEYVIGILKEADDHGILIKIKDIESYLNNKMVWISIDTIESIHEGDIENDGVLDVRIKNKNKRK
jgi:hypothetical protein